MFRKQEYIMSCRALCCLKRNRLRNGKKSTTTKNLSGMTNITLPQNNKVIPSFLTYVVTLSDAPSSNEYMKLMLGKSVDMMGRFI